MTASRLARRELPKEFNTALRSLTRACHCLRTAPCLELFGKLCIHQYYLDGVQRSDAGGTFIVLGLLGTVVFVLAIIALVKMVLNVAGV